MICSTDDLSAALFGCEPTYLGRFQGSVEGARQKAEEETAALLVELFPSLEFSQVDQLTTLLVGGRAAPKQLLDQSVPWLWSRLEDLVPTNAMYPETYSLLRGRARDLMWFGLRRLSDAEERGDGTSRGDADLSTQMASYTGPERKSEPAAERDFLLWFLTGYTEGDERFLVVEVDAGRKGFATYVYRCPERKRTRRRSTRPHRPFLGR